MSRFIYILFILYKFSKEYPSILSKSIITVPTNNNQNNENQNKLSTIVKCSCKLDENICNYHCCCDGNCDDTLKQNWRNKNLCIDERNSLNKAPYTCISTNFFVFHMDKNRKIRKRRGFEIIKDNNNNENDEDNDYCFQIDNSRYQTEKYSLNLVNKLMNDSYREMISKEYVESNIINSISIRDLIGYENNDKFAAIYLDVENSIFSKGNIFVVYGPDLYGDCIPIPVQFYKVISQSKCRYNGGIRYSNIRNLPFTRNINEEINIPNDENYIFEIDFLIYVDKYNQIIQNEYSSYNLIVYNNDYNDKSNVIFNVRFKDDRAEGDLQSGRIGYSIGQPLIVKRNNIIYQYGYPIRTPTINCLLTSNQFELNYEKPILFGENFYYSCKFDNISYIQDTYIFDKIRELINDVNINIYGSTHHTVWTNIITNDELNNKLPNFYKINFYVDSIGPSNGPIYRINHIELNVDYTYEQNNDFFISLEIEYIFLKSAKNYKTSGSVLPKMPHDIIQPFVELDI
jgi:hypothetical protein